MQSIVVLDSQLCVCLWSVEKTCLWPCWAQVEVNYAHGFVRWILSFVPLVLYSGDKDWNGESLKVEWETLPVRLLLNGDASYDSASINYGHKIMLEQSLNHDSRGWPKWRNCGKRRGTFATKTKCKMKQYTLENTEIAKYTHV